MGGLHSPPLPPHPPQSVQNQTQQHHQPLQHPQQQLQSQLDVDGLSEHMQILDVQYTENKEWMKNDFADLKEEKEIILPLNASLLSWTLENLIKNGLDAMKGIGSLGVTIQEQKNEVSILVRDQGSGIAPKALKQIFKPGFTTKSRGWGLGLSLAKRIVHDYHQGFIQVKESKLDQGTTFEIMLPKA